MTPQEAFCEFVEFYRARLWDPRAPDQPKYRIDGEDFSPESLFYLVSDSQDKLPDKTFDDIWWCLHAEYPSLTELLGREPTYATGVTCMLTITRDRQKRLT